MSRATTAVMLSALILPGAGQLFQKRYGYGLALVGASLICVWIIMEKVMQQASSMMSQLELGNGVVDPGQIAEMVSQSSNQSSSGSVTLATIVLGGCWLFGVYDAHRFGQAESKPPARPKREW